jgi:hypothetical protein
MDSGYPQSGSYQIEGQRVALRNGQYSDVNGDLSVHLAATGDADRDGREDLAVVLVQNSRGSGVFYYLNVLLAGEDGNYEVADEAFLGDRVLVDSLSIEGDGVLVEMKVRDDDEPMAAPPTVQASREWKLDAARLVKVASASPQVDDWVMGASKQVDPDEEKASTLLAPFKRELKAALLDGMAAGPAAAIDACKLEAPAIARRLSVDGVIVGRTSHRLRNPDNTAPDWVSPVLAEYLEQDGDWKPGLVDIGGERKGYVEPIAMQALCASCHGSALAPEIAERIAALYPEDQATGFDVGDLRGVFWVEFAP